MNNNNQKLELAFHAVTDEAVIHHFADKIGRGGKTARFNGKRFLVHSYRLDHARKAVVFTVTERPLNDL